ncbi:MAG TPA: hypothetical protein VMK12_31070 [Anaeromyxobacteraceae bacterium]|nr:hypothetical protein [Anaeromyxobacteraceae bacterium]
MSRHQAGNVVGRPEIGGGELRHLPRTHCPQALRKQEDEFPGAHVAGVPYSVRL